MFIYSVIQTPAYFPVSATLLIQVVDKISFGPAAFIWDTVLVVRRKELDGRETTNVVSLSDVLVLCIVSVDVCHDTLPFVINSSTVSKKRITHLHYPPA